MTGGAREIAEDFATLLVVTQWGGNLINATRVQVDQ
jgi:hypothetical protein